MIVWLELAILLALPFIVVIAFVGFRKMPRRLKVHKYVGDWKQLQNFCKDRATWPQALQDADTLLDQALRRRKYRGNSMGERLVSAQRKLTDNDSIWTAHNLTKKIITNPKMRLQESAVKSALVAYRQALKDLGALPHDKR